MLDKTEKNIFFVRLFCRLDIVQLEYHVHSKWCFYLILADPKDECCQFKLVLLYFCTVLKQSVTVRIYYTFIILTYKDIV